jgi:hypothetical protein
MVVISIKKPTPRVLSKLRNGHKVRIMAGEGISLALMEDKAREILKKIQNPMKGVHIQLSPEEIFMNRSVSGNGIFDVFKSIGNVVAPIAKDVALSVGKDAAKSALKSAISGSGARRGRPRKMQMEGEGFFDVIKSIGNVVAPIAKDVALTVGKDAAKSALKSAITGSGARRRGRPRKMQMEGEGFFDDIAKAFSPVTKTFTDLGNDVAGTATDLGNKIAGTATDIGNKVAGTAQDVGAFAKKIGQDLAEDVVGEFNRIKKTPVGKKINSAFSEVKKTFAKGGTAQQLGKGIASALIHQGIPFVLSEACGALAVAAFPEGGPASSLLGSKLGNALGVAIANKIGSATGYGFSGGALGIYAMNPISSKVGLPMGRGLFEDMRSQITHQQPVFGRGLFEDLSHYVTHPQPVFGRGMYAGSGLYAGGEGLYAGGEGMYAGGAIFGLPRQMPMGGLPTGRGLTVNTEGGNENGVGRFSMNKRGANISRVGRTLIGSLPLRSDPYGENFAMSRTLPIQYQRLHHS